jgi:hypothetical protein
MGEEKNRAMREGVGVAWGRGFERATERRKYKFTYIYSIYMKINEPERSSTQMEFGVEFIRIRVGDRVGKNIHSRPLVVQLNKFTRKKDVSKKFFAIIIFLGLTGGKYSLFKNLQYHHTVARFEFPPFLLRDFAAQFCNLNPVADGEGEERLQDSSVVDGGRPFRTVPLHDRKIRDCLTR